MASLLLVSLPLLPVVVMVTALCHSPLRTLYRHARVSLLRFFRGKVCVIRTHAYVFSECTHGQAASVLAAFDLYATAHASLSIGLEKGEFLDEVVRRAAPVRALELGMHCGYASVRILRLLPPSGHLLTVEADPLAAEKGEEIILVAGFKNTQFRVLACSSDEAIPRLTNHLGGGSLDLVVMDHDPERYLPDLLALRRRSLLSTRSVLLLNGTQEPGARALLSYVTAKPQNYIVGRQLKDMVAIHCHIDPHSQEAE